MRRIGTLAGALAVALAATASAASVDDLIKEFSGDAGPARRTPAQLEAAYAQVLAALIPDMGKERVPDRAKSQQTFERISLRAGRPGAGAERLALSKAMAARLGPATPKQARIWLLKQLQHIGRDEAAAAVARLLGEQDPLIRERARRALQDNPSPAVPAALRAALAKATEPAWRVALINAMAYRADGDTVGALIEQARDTDESVRTAAVEALGRIGDKAAEPAIATATTRGATRARRIATDNYLLLADKLAAKGDKASALSIYRKLLGAKGHIRCAAIIGLGRAGGVAELETIFAALADKDARIRGAALGALAVLPPEAVTEALNARVNSAKPELKVALLRALAERADEASLPPFLAAVSDADAKVRLEAYAGMAKIGSDKAGPTLVKALLKAKGDELGAVKNALIRIPGKGVDDALSGAVEAASPARCIDVIQCLVARRAPAAIDTLLKAAEMPDTRVRAAALKGLGELGDASTLPKLLKKLLAAKDERARGGPEKAVAAVCRRLDDPQATAPPLLDAYQQAGDTGAKASLIRILGRVRGDKALALVRSLAKAADATLRDAAVRALAAWGEPAVAADLIAIAKESENQAHRVLALRGYVDVVGLIRGRPADEMIKLYDDSMSAARRPADKKMVLAGLANVANLAALRMVERYRTDPELSAEAIAASVKIATAIGGSHRKAAVTALEQAIRLSDNKRIIAQARNAIGVIRKFDDYIVSWEVSGPYTEAKGGKSHFDYAFPPEDPKAKGVRWQPMRVGTDRNRPWLLGLDKVLGGSNRVAYLRTRIYSPKAQKVRMELGSDDGVKLWIAGKLVHRNPATRPCRAGQDKKTIALPEGWSDMLMKVTQGGGEWAACLRFVATDGSRLKDVRAEVDGQ